MKVYVSFRTDVEPNTRIASPSFTKIKEALKEHEPGAEFTVVLFDFKPNVENLCKAIVDVTEIQADSATDYKINAQGQLREVK
jgi:hypothetical protein